MLWTVNSYRDIYEPVSFVCHLQSLATYAYKLFLKLMSNRIETYIQIWMKQDAADQPECSHVGHFCETTYLNSLVHFSPVTVPLHCRLWNAEEGGVWSVDCTV